MRIALCSEFPLYQRGGVEVLVCALLEALSTDHEIHLVSKDATKDVLASPHGRFIRGHFQWNPDDLGSQQVQSLIQWAKIHQIELFHFHMGGTYAWNARSWNKCAITSCHQAGFTCLTTNHQALSPLDSSHDPRPLAKRLVSFLLRWPGKACQLSSVFKEVHVSRHDLKTGQLLFPLHRSKFTQIYHSRINATSSGESEVYGDSKMILSLATIAFRKGQHILAEAFARIAHEFPQWTLHLVGYHADAACVDRVRQIARDHKIEDRIHLPGPTSEPLELLKTAEVYVQASLLEGLGLSLQEAMLHGCACIGSDTGGIPELICDSSAGMLFKPGDSYALAEILRQLIRDETYRRTLGEGARASMQSRGMTLEAMAGAYRSLYLEANSQP